VATPIIAGVYWRAYGPKNFLWLSDLALASTTLSVIGENRLLASLPAVGTLPLEAAWTIDFLSSGRALGLTGYMFDRQYPLGLRALSLFHVALPPTLIWMLARLGYDRRAFRYQTVLVWCVLPLTYALTEPEKNVNWVFGPGNRPQRRLPPLLYLALEMAAMPVLAILPTHLVLERAFGSSPSDAQRDPARRGGTRAASPGFDTDARRESGPACPCPNRPLIVPDGRPSPGSRKHRHGGFSSPAGTAGVSRMPPERQF
jgi:hypothetical protein